MWLALPPFRGHGLYGFKSPRNGGRATSDNGKIERFHRTLADGWVFKRFYTSERQRRAAMPAWIHQYNHHRPHTPIGKVPLISRLTNLAGQYS